MENSNMKLIVTIDTEEDNWARYSAMNNPVRNIDKISTVQHIFDQYGIKPTYLVTYPVATNRTSVQILKRILNDGKCEIGMHCHPWNTPPFNKDEIITEKNTMLCQLPETLVHKKLTVLHEAICKNFGIVPFSFRAGRWGFGSAISRWLCNFGYRVDTSVTPYTNWENYFGPNYKQFNAKIFRFDANGVQDINSSGSILEVPATIGFLQSNQYLCQRLYNMLDKKIYQKMHMKGLLERMHLLNKVWLSPELSNTEQIIKLANILSKKNNTVLNFTFHSTSLIQGLGPFVTTKDDAEAFYKKISKFMSYAKDQAWQFMTLSELEESMSNEITPNYECMLANSSFLQI